MGSDDSTVIDLKWPKLISTSRNHRERRQLQVWGNVGRCDSAVIGVDVLAMRELMHAKHTLSINTNSAFQVLFLLDTLDDVWYRD